MTQLNSQLRLDIMTSSRKPLLLLLFSFLLVMLWQAWVLEGVHDKGAPTAQTEKTLPPVQPSITVNKSSQSKDAHVDVHTDLMTVRINKYGGFIEKAWLNDYPNGLNDPEPFTLLNYQDNHAFIAQTGFTGDNQLVYTASHEAASLGPEQDSVAVRLTASSKQGVQFEKVYTFHRGQYHYEITSTVKNRSTETWTGYHYSDFTGFSDTDIKAGAIPTPKEFNVDLDAPKPGWFTFNTFSGPSYYTPDTPYVKFPFTEMANKKLHKQVPAPNWIAIQQRYFISAWIPAEGGEQTLISNWQNGSTGYNNGSYRQSFDFTSQGEPITLAPGAEETRVATLYTGPELAANLAPLARGLELTIDYGWLWFISDLLFQVLNFIHKYLGSWGWSIIMTTLLVKLVFYKMSEASYRTMALQRKLKPRIDAIAERYPDDAEKKNQATMELYQKENINPLSGCLPTLLQIPFFLALYYVLIESIQLRLASFLWIPDLSSKDPLYILPILLTASMLLMQRLSPPQSDPVQDRAMQVVPLFMGVMFSQFPAGLVLYWLTNNLLSFIQQFYVMRKYQAV